MRFQVFSGPQRAPELFRSHKTLLKYSNEQTLTPPAPSSENGAGSTVPESSLSVGLVEDLTFKNTASVEDWRGHEDNSWQDHLRNKVSSSAGDREFLRFLTMTSSSIVRYAVQGLASIALARLVIDGSSSDSYLSKMQGGFNNQGLSLLGEAAHAALQEYEEIEAGKYSFPFNYDIRHPDQRISGSLSRALPYFGEAVSTLRRRSQSAAGSEPEIETWLKGDAYPSYYGNSFHYQSDGWMSSSSANIYETSTQTLFLGRQDFMQKTALSSISSFYDKNKSTSPSPRPLKVLEIGCGTGRFSVYLRDSVNSMTGADSLDLTLVDLSPFYLQKARKNHRDYESFKRRTSRKSVPDAKVTYVQGNGEELDSLTSEEGYDIVICMYMFHELPPSARANVAKSMSRLTKEGGLAVFTDSIQKGDRPVLDDSIGAFKSFNEPFYDTYIEEDVGALFEENGMEREEKWLSSVTKTLTFTKK